MLQCSVVRRIAITLLAFTALVPNAAQAATDVTLSDERTHTVWAHAEYGAPALAEPRAKSRRLTKLHLNTEDGLPEVYIVLRRFTDDQKRRWFKVRIPGRSGPPRAWVKAVALGPLHTVRTHLTIDRAAKRAVLRRGGKKEWSAPVGIGAPGTPTPKGNFWIREGFPGGGGIYGAYAFGTSAYSTLTDWPGGGVVGIHGTNQPGLIPGRPSHGCVRLRNRAIRYLARHMPVGTPVEIR